MSIADFLTDLFNPDLAFLSKALAVAVMSSIVCGVIGCHVVLRGMAFIGDAVAHAVFPGLAVAFVTQGSLVMGGTIAGILTAVLVAVFSHNRRIKEDAIIGVFFVGAFALGIVIISRSPGYAGSLQQFLFGSITGIADRDLATVAVAGLVVLGVMFAGHKDFVAVSLDREMARALGLKVFWLDIVLYVCVTLAVVISVQIIGNILVLALVVTPAATARLLTDRLGVMMLLSPSIGGGSSIVGLYLSWSYDLPVGGTIVLVLTASFLAAWLLAPRHGLLAKLLRPVRATGVLLILAGLVVVSSGAGSPAAASVHPAALVLIGDQGGGLGWTGGGDGDSSAISLTTAARADVGWSLAGLEPESYRSDLVRFQMSTFDGPGQFTAMAVSPFGEPEVLLDSAAGIDEFVLQVGRQGSMRWGFSEPGLYQLRLDAAIPGVPGGVASASATYEVTVVAEPIATATAAPTEIAGFEAPSGPTTVAASALAAPATERSAASAAAPAANRVVIAEGHVDMGPRFVDGEWRVQLRDDSSATVTWRDLADVVLQVRDAARIKVPVGEAYSFLGAAGSDVYVLPQVQQTGLVWPGWNTQDPSVLQDVPGAVTWRLRKVEGPGRVVLYLAGSFGQTDVLFNTGESLPQELAIERNTHVHGNWAFSEPGVYRLTVEMQATSASGAALTDTRVLSFAVGDDVDPASAFSAAPVATGASAAEGDRRAGGGTAGRGQMATTGSAHVPAQVGAGVGFLVAGAAALLARRRLAARNLIKFKNHSRNS